jgi:uncharacterized membrane protein
MSFGQIPWFLLCGGLTAVGLIGSWFALRRRGVRAALRGVAWSLLPIALYLLGILQVLWRFGFAIGDFFGGLVFSPKVWIGVILAGVAVTLFVVTGGLRGRERKRRRQDKADDGTSPRASEPSALTAAVPATRASARPQAAPVAAKRKGSGDDEDFGDVADILRRHGIS